MKIDLMIVPTVSILYLFCFIDVSLLFSAHLHSTRNCTCAVIGDSFSTHFRNV